MLDAPGKLGGLGYRKVDALPGEHILASGGCAHGYRYPWLITGEIYLTNCRLIWTPMVGLGSALAINPDDVKRVEAVDLGWLLLRWRKGWLVEAHTKIHLFSMDWAGFWGTREYWIKAIRQWATNQ